MSRWVGFAATSAVFIASGVDAATLLSFKPVPVSPTTPEFDFSGGPAPSFNDGPGLFSNDGDGGLPISGQSAPGIQVDTPLSVLGDPGHVNNSDGSTTFFDVTMDLTGLTANSAAVNIGVFVQSLGSGSFSLFSTKAPAKTLLLSGNITSAAVVGSGDAGSTFDASGVTYTGGSIYNKLVAIGGTVTGGSFSFSMTDVSPTFSINGTTLYLNPFTANGEGSFTTPFVPEPATLGLAGIGLLALTARRPRRI